MGKRGPKIMITALQTEAICRKVEDGAPYHVAARFGGISKDTMFDWMKRGRAQKRGMFRDFLDAVEDARARAIDSKVQIVKQGAEGYEVEKTQVKQYTNKHGRIVRDVTITKDRVRHPMLATWWLEKMGGDEFRPKQALEHSGPGGGPIDMNAPQAQVIFYMPFNPRFDVTKPEITLPDRTTHQNGKNGAGNSSS